MNVWIALVVVAGLACVREFLVIWLPWYVAVNAVATGRKEAAARIFRRVITRPCLFSRSLQDDSRFRLCWLEMEAGRYQEAVDVLQACLKRRQAPAREAQYRQRLAEALEGAGDAAGAENERRRATELVGNLGDCPDGMLVEAKNLSRQQRYAESYALYERALERIPAANSELRSQTMVQLALAAFNAGRAEDTIRWGEAALGTAGATITVRMTGHSVTALGLLNMGRLDEAETHRRKALEIANMVGNTDQAAQYTAQLADIVRRRGQITEALRLCGEARGLSVAQRRHVYAVEQECLQCKGQYKEALELLQAMRRAKGFATPTDQRRSEATQDGFEATVLVELGRATEALALNAQALAQLANDTKLSLQFQADRAWILAELGRGQEAEELLAQVQAKAPEIAVSRSAKMGLLRSQGRAYQALGRWEDARGAWECYLELEPEPVDLPKAYYYAALALRSQGSVDEASASFQKAVETGGDTQYRRLAVDALADPGT